MIFLPQLEIPGLAENEVHVWLVMASEDTDDHLSPYEISHASRYRKKIDRLRYRMGRNVLRKILSGYLSVEPLKIHLELDQYGKPRLSEKFHEPTIDFNISHSDQLILFAFARSRRVGVDLEHIRPFPELAHVVSRYFTEQESSTMSSMPKQQRTSAFFRGWTRKEALLKSIGKGLLIPLNTFEVSLDSGDEDPQLVLPHQLNEGAQWQLISFSPADEYIAALAVEGHGWAPKFYKFA